MAHDAGKREGGVSFHTSAAIAQQLPRCPDRGGSRGRPSCAGRGFAPALSVRLCKRSSKLCDLLNTLVSHKNYCAFQRLVSFCSRHPYLPTSYRIIVKQRNDLKAKTLAQTSGCTDLRRSRAERRKPSRMRASVGLMFDSVLVLDWAATDLGLRCAAVGVWLITSSPPAVPASCAKLSLHPPDFWVLIRQGSVLKASAAVLPHCMAQQRSSS